jgi:hypothetical protein
MLNIFLFKLNILIKIVKKSKKKKKFNYFQKT